MTIRFAQKAASESELMGEEDIMAFVFHVEILLSSSLTYVCDSTATCQNFTVSYIVTSLLQYLLTPSLLHNTTHDFVTMPPTRKRAEPDKNENENQIPTYSSEVAWLACLTDPSKDFDANEEIANGEINNALITEACKLSYILYHNIQAQDCLPKILQSLNKSGTEDETELTRVAKSKQSAWKAHVLNKFLLPHVKEIVRKWCVARPYASFGSLPASDRNKLWLEAYDASPKGTVISMWKPVIGVLDLGLIFRTDLPDEHNTNMAAVRQMLQQKYCFGCECTYKYSVADTKKVSDAWNLVQG